MGPKCAKQVVGLVAKAISCVVKSGAGVGEAGSGAGETVGADFKVGAGAGLGGVMGGATTTETTKAGVDVSNGAGTKVRSRDTTGADTESAAGLLRPSPRPRSGGVARAGEVGVSAWVAPKDW